MVSVQTAWALLLLKDIDGDLMFVLTKSNMNKGDDIKNAINKDNSNVLAQKRTMLDTKQKP